MIQTSTFAAAPRPPAFGRLGVRLSEAGRRAPLFLGWAAVVAVLMSTEFLFQPFIWRNFDLESIARVWLLIARDRLIVAFMIGLMLSFAVRGRAEGPAGFIPFVLLAALGASLGEGAVTFFSAEAGLRDAISAGGRILRWSIVGAAIAVLVNVWRVGGELAAAAEEARLQESRARRLAASSQLEMLRRQIEPHFLFNTLATIRRLHETDPAAGRRVLSRLLRFMSATLGEQSGAASTLGQEIDLVLAYLDVCGARMAGRLKVVTDVPPELAGLSFPPLVLATLAENAVKHAVFPQNGGEVGLSARLDGDVLEVVISDDGPGLSGEGGGGLGLSNVIERLKLLYGDDASFQLQGRAPTGVRAAVRIPAAPR